MSKLLYHSKGKFFLQPDGQEEMSAETEVALLRDRDSIVVTIRSFDADIEKYGAGELVQGIGSLTYNCVSASFVVGSEIRWIAINPNGGFMYRGNFGAVTPILTAKSFMSDDNSWTGVMRFPIEELFANADTKDRTIRFNVDRRRGEEWGYLVHCGEVGNNPAGPPDHSKYITIEEKE